MILLKHLWAQYLHAALRDNEGSHTLSDLGALLRDDPKATSASVIAHGGTAHIGAYAARTPAFTKFSTSSGFAKSGRWREWNGKFLN